MLRRKPTYSYCGLTIVLENPSRFDLKNLELLSANGGCFFNEECLAPTLNVYQCDIRTKEDKSPLLSGTKVVLLLGEEAMRSWLPELKLNRIGEVRGSIYSLNESVYAIPSFFPQDATDIQDYESAKNDTKMREAIDDSSVAQKRRHGVTSRANYKFWLKKDVEKAKKILKDGKPEEPIIKANYKIYPNADEIIDVLRSVKNEPMFLDLETNQRHDIFCSGISFGLNTDVYVFPWLDYKYNWPYTKLPQIIFAFKEALKNNTAVAHNGAAFDFLVLARKYRLPVYRVQDTMLMHHRCYMFLEKSLGHCTSLWTNEPFHKDEGGGGYNTNEQMMNMMKYCGKDVYTMKLIYYAMLKHAAKVPGLLDSMNQVNDAIIPYMCMTLEGIRFDDELRKTIMTNNDKLMEQYIRFINILVGEKFLKKLNSSNKTSLAASNKKCVTYFHEMLGYPVVARGKENAKGERNPSLGKEAIFKLKMQYDNPVLDFIIAYREVAKESSSLKFNPWTWKE